ncbi:MAG: glycosyltransferase [Butyrivibrio sp.]|nr:glycosyltransferase [Butyrivibrio sp.]
MEYPLVSVMIPNYNHSKYLDECIRSALNQTYKNIEVVLLDNASTDSSVQVAAKYINDDRVRVCKNPINVLNKNYYILADVLTQGKYMILLCADDYLYPDFIEAAVEIMEKNPTVAYVHGEKDLVDDDGNIRYWDPFYKCSFKAKGINAMPIYMVTSVAHPSQGLIRRDAFRGIGGYDKEMDHMNADKTLWFYLSEKYDMAYIREKCCGIRVGTGSQTFIAVRNARHLICYHLTIKDFVKYAKEKGIEKVYKREKEAMERLALEFVGYSAGMLMENEFSIAYRYLMYAKVLHRDVEKTELYKNVYCMVKEEKSDKVLLEKMLGIDDDKKRGYEPPEGYLELVKGVDYGTI